MRRVLTVQSEISKHSYQEEAQLAAFGAYKPFLEDGAEISVSEESSDHGEELHDMFTPGCHSAAEALISEETMQLFIECGLAGGLGRVITVSQARPL
jgi:hypothetical protein